MIIRCDNQAAVAMINKGTTANPTVMLWLRHLFWLSAIHNFRISAVYIPGVDNVRADSISRMHLAPSLLQFYSCLCQELPPPAIHSKLLVDHMSPATALFLISRYGQVSVQGAS